MKKIKFAVIGLGHIGKRHAEMIKRNPDAELVAVCDILPKSETGFDGDQQYFSSIDEFLSAKVDADARSWLSCCDRETYRIVEG